MGKLEKYHDYIVKDLISKTEFDEIPYHGRLLKLPFVDPHTWTSFDEYLPTLIYPSKKKRKFGEFVSNRYGVPENEYEMLWDIFYRELIIIIEDFMSSDE